MNDGGCLVLCCQIYLKNGKKIYVPLAAGVAVAKFEVKKWRTLVTIIYIFGSKVGKVGS